jgi:outer membrane receptor protein involved in Fe transport
MTAFRIFGAGLQRRRPCLTAALALLCAALSASAAGQGQTGPDQPKNQDLTALSLEQLGDVKITSASLHEQSIADAPASVTVITAEEIRKFGYRTLAEALSWVRGFYATSDNTYSAIGIRGFSLPGYEARYILMINGHNLADNIVDSTFVGNDFPLDLDLVDRIEVVRGASSALYGSNGMLATINVITRRPSDVHGTSVRSEIDSLGERKLEANTAVALGRGANLLISGSAYNNAGAHELYFSALDSAQNNFGRAINMDGEKGYRAFADLTWGNWEALAVAGDRVKIQPVSWADTVFNDPGTRAEDSRGFFELSYTRDLPGDRTLTWRTSYDEYRYRGIYHYPLDGGIEDTREHDYGDWIGSKLTYRLPDSPGGHLTLGSEVSIDLRALQNAFDVQPEKAQWLLVDRRDRYAGLFAQQEWAWGRHWELNLGARFDWSWLKRSAVSPRVSAIYKPSARTDLKLMYGRGFRNPSAYDMFYDDGITEVGNAALRPETNDTYELDVEHAFTGRLRANASVYRYQVGNLIEQVFTPAGLVQFVNADRVHAAGASLELEWLLPASIRLSSSLEIQRAVFGTGEVLPNSPGQVGKLRLAMPVWRNRLVLSAGLQALGQRQTLVGATVPWVILPEAVVSTKQLPGGFQVTAGIKNLSNSFYRDPAGLTPTVDTVIGSGRTYFLNIAWHSSAEPQTAGVNRQVPARP